MQNFTFRKAKIEDYESIASLLTLSNLPLAGIEDYIDNYILLISENKIIAVIGLEIYGSVGLLRSFAVDPSLRYNGLGMMLYKELISSAKESGIKKIFLLTETAEKFFSRQGFKVINRKSADDSVKQSIEFKSACPQSAVCMMLEIE